MERRNIIPTFKRRMWLAAVTAAPTTLALGLGAAKIAVGISRGRPVGYLILTCMTGTILRARTELSQHRMTRVTRSDHRGLRRLGGPGRDRARRLR